jgi:hypothetical protein
MTTHIPRSHDRRMFLLWCGVCLLIIHSEYLGKSR